MRGGGGVDGAIHRAGGPAVLEDCIAPVPHGLATGDAGWTTAGDDAGALGDPRGRAELRPPARRDRSLLTSCYARALAVADELGARTVAFPLVSAGVYGWPKDDAIAAAVSTLRSTADPGRGGAAGRLRPPARTTRWWRRSMADAAGRPVFVLHEHRKPQPHFDLRLEEDGVLSPGRCPKGMPTDSAAATGSRWPVGDHDLDHATYTDERRRRSPTPAGGSSRTAPTKRFVFVLHGRDGARRYALIDTGSDWLLHLTKAQPPAPQPDSPRRLVGIGRSTTETSGTTRPATDQRRSTT